MSESQKTPMYEAHVEQGGKMVDFAGWEMPVTFAGIKEEHAHVRTKAGLFDVSHMGEIRVRGRDSLKTLQWLTTNDVSKLEKGQAQYTLFPNEKGGVVDDLIVYCITPGEDYLLCVNAANTDKDFKYLMENNRGAVIENESSQWGQMAIQGPQAIEMIEKITGTKFSECPSFNFVEWTYKDQLCYIARTGYTGEDGAEIFVPWDVAQDLWNEFLAEPDAMPIGLGARDTLRTEMRYPLYGQ
ncbi:MAG: glycine cleavage system aminomethyltransferase GcvT, partial [Bdellovibrionales bacterium]|nr:glycine cleavage system aminomethyltransferase GcvT [Bdellovibrionales bacterium]